MDPRGKVALVTGASSGIGLETARLLARRGCKVALVARRVERLEALARELGDAEAFPLDVARLDEVQRLPEAVRARFGRLDILVNNAGVHHRGSMLRHDPLVLAEMVAVNLASPIVLTRAAVSEMKDGGVVVNVASLAGKLGVPGSAVYAATKAGLRFFALGAAGDLSGVGVRVANVNPGPVDSGFLDADIENVSPLTFSQPMSTSLRCAEAVLEAIASGESPLEIDVPRLSGKLATLGYLAPRLQAIIRPMLERRGIRAKSEYMRRRGLGM